MMERIRLRAEDAEDLAILSAMLQDARAPLREMMYDPEAGRFLVAFTRYRRELLKDPCSCEGLLETPSVLTIEEAGRVLYRGLDAAEPEREHTLLTVATEPGSEGRVHIHLVFEGRAEIQVRARSIRCRLEDFGESVPCRVNPCDHFAESGREG